MYLSSFFFEAGLEDHHIFFSFTVQVHTVDVAIRADKDADVASLGRHTWHMACVCGMLACA
jgi:hypothetical protein